MHITFQLQTYLWHQESSFWLHFLWFCEISDCFAVLFVSELPASFWLLHTKINIVFYNTLRYGVLYSVKTIPQTASELCHYDLPFLLAVQKHCAMELKMRTHILWTDTPTLQVGPGSGSGSSWSSQLASPSLEPPSLSQLGWGDWGPSILCLQRLV